jgi:hypothetical protein
MKSQEEIRTVDEEEHRDGLQESSTDTTLEAHPQAARGGQAQHTWTHCGEEVRSTEQSENKEE